MAGLSEIRAVVFDAVGTLIHPHPPAAIVYAEVGHRFGSRLTPSAIASRFAEALAREEAFDREHGWQTNEIRERERWQRIVAAVLEDVSNPQACFEELFAHFGRPNAWQCDPEAASTLSALQRRGYTLGLASNYDHRLRSVVAGLAPLQLIEHVTISSEVGWRKPAAEFFAALCRTLNLPAAQVLFVGDDLANDFTGAQSAGLHAVLLDRAGKLPLPPQACLRSLRDLLDEDVTGTTASALSP